MNTVVYSGVSLPVDVDQVIVGLSPSGDTIPSWFYRDVDGVREIAITGVLVPYGFDYPGIIGCDWILEAISSVDRVRLFVDSPGGILHPNLEKVMIRLQAIESECVVTGACTSAAFLVGLSCRRVVADVKSCEVGGLGAFMLLWDAGEKNRRDGFKPIVIKTGQYKAIGAGGEYDEVGLAHLRERLFSVFSVYLGSLTRKPPEAYHDARVVTAIEALSDGVIDGILGGFYTLIEGEQFEPSEEINSMNDEPKVEDVVEGGADVCADEVGDSCSNEHECGEADNSNDGVQDVDLKADSSDGGGSVSAGPVVDIKNDEVGGPKTSAPTRLPIRRVSEDFSAEKLFDSLVKKFGSRTEAWRALERINYDAYLQLRTKK